MSYSQLDGGHSIEVQTRTGHSIAFNMFLHFALCDPVTLTFDLIDGRGLVMDYPCGKFIDCSFSRFGFIVQTETHTDAANRLTPVTVVSVSI